jgi:hypothetical protein
MPASKAMLFAIVRNVKLFNKNYILLGFKI